jgi:hypothetical protein
MPGNSDEIETFAVGALDMQIRSLLDRQQFSDPLGVTARAGISSTDRLEVLITDPGRGNRGVFNRRYFSSVACKNITVA